MSTWLPSYRFFQCHIPEISAALRLQRMREIAEERGGACLSEVYLGSRKKLVWQCHQGHVWQAMPVSVTWGTWCPVCVRLNQCTSDKACARCLAVRYL